MLAGGSARVAGLEHDICGMDAAGDHLGEGNLHGRQTVGQDSVEDVNHLPNAIISTGKLAPYALNRSQEHPMLEGSTAA